MLWSWIENDDENWTHGTFSTKEDAIKDAIKENELGTFLVQFVKEDEPNVIFRSRVGYV